MLEATTVSGKVCPRCTEYKEFGEFYRVRSRADGYASWCKKCSNGSRFSYRKAAVHNQVVKSVQTKPDSCQKCNNQVSSKTLHWFVDPDTESGSWLCVTCKNDWYIQSRMYCVWCCDPIEQRLKTKYSRYCSVACGKANEDATERKTQELLSAFADLEEEVGPYTVERVIRAQKNLYDSRQSARKKETTSFCGHANEP
jgi:hypothetical protein